MIYINDIYIYLKHKFYTLLIFNGLLFYNNFSHWMISYLNLDDMDHVPCMI